MKYILMNKNKEIMLINYNKVFNIIDKIYNIYNLNYAPLSFVSAYNQNENLIEIINNWLKRRK